MRLELVDVISTANVTKTSDNDTTSQGATVVQLGVGYTGEDTGNQGQVFYPIGYWSPPLPSQVGQDGTQYLGYGRTDEYFLLGGRDYLNQGKFKATMPGEVQVGAVGSDKGANLFIHLDSSINLATTSDSTANFINMTGTTITLGNGTTPKKAAYIDPLCTCLSALQTLNEAIQTAATAGAMSPDPTGVAFQTFAAALVTALPAAITALSAYASATPANGTTIVELT